MNSSCDGMMNFKDSITNKVEWLILTEVLARDIFMSKPVSELFPCGGIYFPSCNSCYLSCLLALMFFFLSVAKIFRVSSPIISDPYYFKGVQSFSCFLVNTNTEPLSQNTMHLVWQPEINWFSTAASSYLRPTLNSLPEDK